MRGELTGKQTPDIFTVDVLFSTLPHGLHALWLGKKGMWLKKTRLVAKRGLQPTGWSELLQLVPARSPWVLASSLGWLSPVVPWSARGRPGGRCLSPGPGLFPTASGRFGFLPTRWAAPPVPRSSGSAHNTALLLPPEPPRCHLPPCFQAAGRWPWGRG